MALVNEGTDGGHRCVMSDPGKLDLSDWLSLAVVSIGGGMSAAMLWFRASNLKRDERTDDLYDRVEKYRELVTALVTELAVLKACQNTIQDKLDEIKNDIVNSAERGAHSVNAQMAYMLTEVQKIVGESKRRHE